MLVHLFGWTSASPREIRAFCKERDIALLEDGAQCFGVEAFGEPVLAKADIATLSFYPAKVVGGAMDGGAVTMQSKDHEAFAPVSSATTGAPITTRTPTSAGTRAWAGSRPRSSSRVLDQRPEILESRRAAAAWYRERLTATQPTGT